MVRTGFPDGLERIKGLINSSLRCFNDAGLASGFLALGSNFLGLGARLVLFLGLFALTIAFRASILDLISLTLSDSSSESSDP